MIQDLKSAAPAELSAWVIEPYGAPTGTSEVNRIEGFYRLEALTAFGSGKAGERVSAESPELPERIAA